MVLTPFEAGEAAGMFNLLLVDETHRLNQRANQPSGVLNNKFSDITIELFGADDYSKTQLLDTEQSIRPADLPSELLSALIAETRASERHFQLKTQMRVRAGSDFVAYIRWILNPSPTRAPPQLRDFGDYDFRIFDNVALMRDEIL